MKRKFLPYTIILLASMLIGLPILIYSLVSSNEEISDDFSYSAAVVTSNTVTSVTTPETTALSTTVTTSDKAETTVTEAQTSAETTIVTETTTPTETSVTQASFVATDMSYFNDALFIGDSRTVGIAEYSGMTNAVFFADTGMNIYKVAEKRIPVKGVGEVTLGELLSSRKFTKVYIMLGVNEIGYNMNNTLNKYSETLTYIRSFLPDCIIYIQANLHVTSAYSAKNKYINNPNLNQFNTMISGLADNVKTFYLDVNGIFDDESGGLNASTTFDGVHLLASYYPQWAKWFSENTVVQP